jgi:hypothetical protein
LAAAISYGVEYGFAISNSLRGVLQTRTSQTQQNLIGHFGGYSNSCTGVSVNLRWKDVRRSALIALEFTMPHTPALPTLVFDADVTGVVLTRRE